MKTSLLEFAEIYAIIIGSLFFLTFALFIIRCIVRKMVFDEWLAGILAAMMLIFEGALSFGICEILAMHNFYLPASLFILFSVSLLALAIIMAFCSFIISVARLFPKASTEEMNKFIDKVFMKASFQSYRRMKVREY